MVNQFCLLLCNLNENKEKNDTNICYMQILHTRDTCMRGSRMICWRWSNNSDQVFFSLLDKGRENQITTKSGSSWRFAGGPMVA